MLPASRTGSDDFRAPWLLRNGHVQTIGASLPFWSPPRSFVASEVRVRIPLPGGGSLHARACWGEGASTRPAMLLVHGLGGSSESRYVARAAVSLFRAGYHVVCLDLRGVGEGADDAPSLNHAGLTEDPRVAAEWVASQPRVGAVILVGFSMGGHVSIRLAGELGAAGGPIAGVVALSAPLDLHTVSRWIRSYRRVVYHKYILRNLVANAARFARLYPERAPFDAARLRGLARIRDYDEAVIVPMHGFADVDDYYRRASAGPLVPRVRLPLLVLHAEDDPVVPPSAVRPWLAGAPSSVEQAWTARGGHVAWVSGMREHDWVDTWGVERTREFAERLVGKPPSAGPR